MVLYISDFKPKVTCYVCCSEPAIPICRLLLSLLSQGKLAATGAAASEVAQPSTANCLCIRRNIFKERDMKQ